MRLRLTWTPGTPALQPQQNTETFAHVDNDVGWRFGLEHDSPSLPIEILQVIRENNPGDLPAGRQRDFERVSLFLTRNRAGDGKERFRVVGARRQDQRWAPAALLMTSLRVKRQPHQITSVGNVRANYHASSPTGGPQSLSWWRFRGVIFATS